MLLMLLGPTRLLSETIDLTKSDLYAKKGFSQKWINSLPVDKTWVKVPGVDTGRRSVRVKDLKIDDLDRMFLSFKHYPPGTYTYVTSFDLPEERYNSDTLLGMYLAQIGLNWEIYLNGNLVKKEMHVLENGEIYPSKNYRDLLVYLLPQYLKPDKNILAFKIVGNPAYQETGFYWKGEYIIDDYEKLEAKNSEMIPMILIFIYLFIGIYHLFLFLKRTSEKYNLFYGLFSLILFTYLLSRSHTVYGLISDTTLITRIELVSLYIMLPIVAPFFDLIFTSKIRKTIIGYGIFCGVMTVPTLFAPLPALIDLLLIWQLTALVFMPYIVIVLIGKPFVDEVKKSLEGKPRGVLLYASTIIRTLFYSIPGTLMLGAGVVVLCGIFDILDAIWLYTGIALLKYGFMFFITVITFILATRFQNLVTEFEILNVKLQKNVDYLNIANRTIALSEEKYRFLVEGSHDLIFSLDENWNFTAVNKNIKNFLKLEPDEVKGMSFYDLLWQRSNEDSVSKRLIEEQIQKFKEDRTAIQFKGEFKSLLAGEPKEMLIRLENVNIEGKNEILGKASSIVEDILAKYFVSEKQSYKIGNYFLTADELSYRMTRNVVKYAEPKAVNLLRIALREMIINAIEHGNLDISFEEKSAALENDEYFNLLSRRQKDEIYMGRTIDIKYQVDSEKVAYQISDQGRGFDYEKMLNADAADSANSEMLAHGRGIAMAKNAFDKISFKDNGTTVILIKYFKK